MFMCFQGGGIGHKGMLKQIAGLQNKEQPADQMNKDLDSEIVEGLRDNDDEEEDEEDEDLDLDSGDESNDSLVEFNLDGEEGGEDEYDILGFAAF
jgi:hypothetical protein